jgi:hypothetical protein
VGQRTFETKSFYLILAEKLFTLPAANEMLPLSALFAGKSRTEKSAWHHVFSAAPSGRMTGSQARLSVLIKPNFAGLGFSTASEISHSTSEKLTFWPGDGPIERYTVLR